MTKHINLIRREEKAKKFGVPVYCTKEEYKKLSLDDKINYLNIGSDNTTRKLTNEEIEKYSILLNKSDNEYCQPYAIRESTNDLISKVDSYNSTSEKLYSYIGNL